MFLRDKILETEPTAFSFSTGEDSRKVNITKNLCVHTAPSTISERWAPTRTCVAPIDNENVKTKNLQLYGEGVDQIASESQGHMVSIPHAGNVKKGVRKECGSSE